MTIWKYSLAVTDVQILSMPSGALLLTVQTQGETPCVWAKVNPDGAMVGRRILTAGTGHNAPDLPWIGTYQLRGGGLVFHVFDGGELRPDAIRTNSVRSDVEPRDVK